MPVPAKHFDAGNRRLAWYEKGSGAPLVCLHGNPSWSVLFRPLFQGLSDSYRVLSLDQAGCGQSGPPAAHYSWDLSARVADFGAWVDHVSPDQPVTLVAHDWGGMVAASWAVDHPDRVAALVFMNTAAFRLPAGKPLPRSIAWCRNALIGQFLVRGLNGFLLGSLKWCTVKPLSAVARAAYLGPHPDWASRRSIYEFVQDIPLKESHRSWNRMKQTEDKLVLLKDKPMLLPWGLKDFVFDGDFLREWQNRFPKAQAIPYAQKGHWLLEDEPDRVVADIRAFLAKNSTWVASAHPATAEVRG